LYFNLRDLQSLVTHVVIKGAGGKAFSAGGDIVQLSTGQFEISKDILRFTLSGFELVSNYKKPYIAIMDGITMGGGSSFSVAGKYRIATEQTVYAMPETAIGFFNDAGASYFLARLKSHVGIYIGLTGARLKGFDVKKVGLATHFVESKKLDDLEKALIECKNDRDIEKTLHRFSSIPKYAASEIDSLIPKVDKCFSAISLEKIYENLGLDGSNWAKDTIKMLNKMSPTSLKISLRNMVEGRTLSLHECLKMEYRVGIHHLIESDLKEGVRALLIDKDLNPKWNPATIEDVTDEHVERFYKPLPGGDELLFERNLSHKL
jgi:3-hydroxyisobutyryl-CoA hydrolase